MARAAARAISQATLHLCQTRIANQTAGASDTVGRLTPYTASQLVSAPLLCSLYFYSDTDGELKLASIVIAEGRLGKVWVSPCSLTGCSVNSLVLTAGVA